MSDVAFSRADSSAVRRVENDAPRRIDSRASRRGDEIDALADEIAVAAATMDSAMHGLLGAIRRFDECKGWARQGARSCAHWLSWRIGVGLGTAHEQVRVARALGELPLIDEALRQGAISYCKVRAMSRVGTMENEALLLRFARSSTGAQLEKICRGFRQVERLAQGERRRGRDDDDDDRFVRRRRLSSGLVRIEAQLSVDEAEVVFQALREVRLAAQGNALATVAQSSAEDSASVPAAMACRAELCAPESAAVPGEATSRAELCAPDSPSEVDQADALVLMAESVLARGVAARSGGERNQLLVVLSERELGADEHGDGARASASTEPGAAPLAAGQHRSVPFKAELGDGSWLSGAALLRLACDAGVVVAAVDQGGTVLDVGRKTRSAPPALMRALRLRDGGCRYPGCCNRAFVDAHHVVHWAHGGETSLANVLLLCSRHHTAVHEGGFRIERRNDKLVFFAPDGREIPAVPPRAAPRTPLGPAEGITVHHHTSLPDWDGRPLDLGACVGGLVSRAGWS